MDHQKSHASSRESSALANRSTAPSGASPLNPTALKKKAILTGRGFYEKPKPKPKKHENQEGVAKHLLLGKKKQMVRRSEGNGNLKGRRRLFDSTNILEPHALHSRPPLATLIAF
jgi:hypothetical protein